MMAVLLSVALSGQAAPVQYAPTSSGKRTEAEREALTHNYDVGPRIKKQTPPKYPPRAFRENVNAEITVEFVIDEAGRVRDPEVDPKTNPVRASTEAANALYESAAATVRQWTFDPATKAGRPVATLTTGTVTFRVVH
jgi:TonB family protein